MNELKLFRTLMCKNILERRKIAKSLRDYAKHGLAKTKIRNLMLTCNTEYLTSLINDIEKLNIEYNYLLKKYYEYMYKKD